MAHQFFCDLWADTTLYQRACKLMPQLVGGEIRLHDGLIQHLAVFRFLAGLVALAAVVGAANVLAVLQPGILIAAFCVRPFAAKDKRIIRQAVQAARYCPLQGFEDRHPAVGVVGFQVFDFRVVIVPNDLLADVDLTACKVLFL